MRSLERAGKRESLDKAIAHVAAAYGFTTPPVTLSRRALADQGEVDHHAAAVMALLAAGQAPAGKTSQAWGVSKRGGGTTLSFSITGGRHAIAHALVIKTALSIAELSGFEDCSVLVSSIGDAESRRRFTRELATFFKKNAEVLPPEVRQKALHDPDAAYRLLLKLQDPARDRLPRPIDFLSENSRKIMTDTLALFESVGIPYQLASHLPLTHGVHGELLFAVTGVTDGERAIIAHGGRFDELMKKRAGAAAVGIALSIPQELDADEDPAEPHCYIIHVGEAARLKAFTLLEAMWQARVSVREALLAETLKEQMDRAKLAKVPYIAIIGQREALDNTVLVRSTATEMQTTIPIAKLAATVTRGKR